MESQAAAQVFTGNPATTPSRASAGYGSSHDDTATCDRRLGSMLVSEKVITDAQLSEALTRKSIQGGFLGQSLVELNFIEKDVLTAFLVRQFHIPYIKLLDYELTRETIDILDMEFCREHRVIAIDQLGSILTVAMVNPLREGAIEAIASARPGVRVKPILCDWTDFEQVFENWFNKSANKKTDLPVMKDSTTTQGDAQVEPEEEVPEAVDFSHLTKTQMSRRRPEVTKESPVTSIDLDEKQTLDSYFTDAAARHLPEFITSFSKKPDAYGNLLYLHGPTGTGKTHLLHALGHAYIEAHPDSSVSTFHAVDLARVFETSGAEASLPAPDQHLFLIDGVGQRLSEERQYALCDWLDRLGASQAVAMAALDPPENEKGLSESLASRCASGLSLAVPPLGTEARRALAQQFAENAELQIGDNELKTLARGLPGDARVVRGALVRLAAECATQKTPPTLEQIEELLAALRAGAGGVTKRK